MLLTLVGVRHRSKEEQEIVKSLTLGDEVFIVRDPENSFDENAIKVLDEYNNHLGFIAAAEAEELAELMDEDGDEPYSAIVEEKPSALTALLRFDLFD